MLTIDDTQALALLRRVVDASGDDHVYDGPRMEGSNACRYVDDSATPCCIVGRALVLAGVPGEALAGYEGQPAVEVLRHLLRRHLIDPYTPDAAHIFQTAQEAQDHGSTWGRALDEALAVAEEVASC